MEEARRRVLGVDLALMVLEMRLEGDGRSKINWLVEGSKDLQHVEPFV